MVDLLKKVTLPMDRISHAVPLGSDVATVVAEGSFPSCRGAGLFSFLAYGLKSKPRKTYLSPAAGGPIISIARGTIPMIHFPFLCAVAARAAFLAALVLVSFVGGCATPAGPEARAAVHFKQATALQGKRAPSSKIEAEYRKALALQPHHAEAYFQLALLISEQPGRKEEAIDLLHLAVRDRPDHVLALVKLGDLLAADPVR